MPLFTPPLPFRVRKACDQTSSLFPVTTPRKHIFNKNLHNVLRPIGSTTLKLRVIPYPL